MNKYSCIVLKAAQTDAFNAKKYYKKHSPAAYKNFIADYNLALLSLENMPERTPKKGDFHILIMNRFPYVFFYTINPKKLTVTVIALFNTHQDPLKIPQ